MIQKEQEILLIISPKMIWVEGNSYFASDSYFAY